MSIESVSARALARVRRTAAHNGYHREELTAFATKPVMGTPTQVKRKRREPEPVGDILVGLYQNRAIAKKLLLPQITEHWADIVGSLVSEHTMPKAVVDEVLYVTANSTVWAAQISALGQVVVTKIREVTGSDEIDRIQVTGPKANVPNYGPRTVKGRQGYRDTFG